MSFRKGHEVSLLPEVMAGNNNKEGLEEEEERVEEEGKVEEQSFKSQLAERGSLVSPTSALVVGLLAGLVALGARGWQVGLTCPCVPSLPPPQGQKPSIGARDPSLFR